jgi:hypothetical protein
MIPRTASVIALASSLVALQATQACSRTDNAPGGSGGDALAPSPARTSNCDRITAMGVCSEYSGSYLVMNEGALREACGKLSGFFVGGQCPNTTVLGSCTLATSEVRHYYASGGVAPYDAARAEKECTGNYAGKWAAFK